MRLKEKVAQADHIKRLHDTPTTPFDRLLAAGVLTPENQERLQALRDATNPCQLRQEIEQRLDRLFTLPCAPQDTVEDVYLTLAKSSVPLR